MSMLKTLVLGCLLAFAPVAFAESCVTLNDRPNGGCFETGCEFFCAHATRTQATSLMPGFFTEYEGGKMVISGVLPNSPAYVAGIRIGDVVLRIDDRPVPFDDVSSVWQKSRSHTVELRRGSYSFLKQIQTRSIQSILSGLPVLSNPLRTVSFAGGDTSFKAEPFLSGMLVHTDGAMFAVDAVLKHSPADSAGIRPGDRLVGAEDTTVSSLQYSNERTDLTLTLRRRGKEERVPIRFAPLPEFLELAAH
jgi:predicted metalloprotease with PDZ domain